MVEDNLANIRENRAVMIDLIGPEPADEARLRDRIVTDRERFLEWVRAYPAVNVLVALHPLDARALTERGDRCRSAVPGAIRRLKPPRGAYGDVP